MLQLLPALAAGLISREDIDLALRHVLAIRFRLGLFDPIESQPYWHVAPSAIGSQQAYAVNLLATQSSMVRERDTALCEKCIFAVASARDAVVHSEMLLKKYNIIFACTTCSLI